MPERFAGRLSNTRSIDLGWYFTQSFAFGGGENTRTVQGTYQHSVAWTFLTACSSVSLGGAWVSAFQPRCAGDFRGPKT